MLQQPRHSEELESLTSGITDVAIRTENPFPGLRSFSIEESYLYFGRESQIDEILVKLVKNRFVTVMGYSGSGKSSLMFCGLVPVLYGGIVTPSSSYWNVVVSRPGTSPISNLTESVLSFMAEQKLAQHDEIEVHRAAINAILRSGSSGLIEVVRYIQTSKNENVCFLIDQFEEIFRFQEAIRTGNESEDDAQLYVQLILTAIQQTHVPVYVALTMRSDFIGECSVFSGLTHEINKSNYLVPQMTREQKRAAVEGPVAVAGANIAERLVRRILNDLGGSHDQLPVMQHALMRTWDYWVANHETGESIDIRHYHAVGRINEALSQHANELYDELPSRGKEIAEIIFKNVTEKNQDNRGLRRPCRLGLITELADASESEVIEVIDHFRKPGRSFLMPAANVPLDSDSLIELSHESLMRIWNRLAVWVEDEFESASMYKRLSEAASMYQIGKTGLWKPPDLQLALNWQKKQKPTREWGQRYDEAFERAIVFLDTSRITHEAEMKNQEMMQRRILRRTRATAIILGVAFLVAILFFVFAYIQKIQADKDRIAANESANEAVLQSQIAEENRKIAEQRNIEVEAARSQLEHSNEQLREILNQLTEEKNRTFSALQKAREEEQKALAASDLEKDARMEAELRAEEARYNYAMANSLFMLTKAQELATKATVQDDHELAGLQAMQGYHFHKSFKGKKYDPYIYNGLYSALTKISGVSYNAMKIKGPPRVHLRSLVLSGNGNDFFVSGADGRIYKGNLTKLSNTPTGFEVPYPSKAIALSKDESYLANASDSSVIQIFPLTGNTKTRVVKGLAGATNALEFLPDNSGFLVASRGKTITKVNHLTGELTVLATLPYEIKAISISHDGKWMAGASWSGQVVLLNLADKSVNVLVDAASEKLRILSVKFSPGGKQLAYGMEEISAHKATRGLVRVYNLQSKETRQFTGHKAGVYDLEFSPDEKLLASAGADKKLQLYVLEFPDDLPVVMDNNNGFIWDIEFSKGSDLLIAACSESEIRVWPTLPSILASQVCPKLVRSMTQDEWIKYVGADIDYQHTKDVCTE